MKRMPGKLVDASWQIELGVAGNLLTDAIRAFGRSGVPRRWLPRALEDALVPDRQAVRATCATAPGSATAAGSCPAPRAAAW